MKPVFRLRVAVLTALVLLFAGQAAGQLASPHAIDIPAWFSESFLDFKEETAGAARLGKRLMVYFGQDGCPYCKELMQTNFSQKAIVDKTRRHFEAIALNIWGDREVTWIDGRKMSEKEFARFLNVQFTPTVLFFDADGSVAARLNGYYPPHRFAAVLDYVVQPGARKVPLAQHLERAAETSANAKLNEQAFFMPPPHDLRRTRGGKPLAVLFETRHCRPCDEMHRDAFTRPELKTQLQRFDVVRFALSERRELITPAGPRQAADVWARELGITFTPTVVFFDTGNREVFRIDGYVRPFHLATAFEYVASGAYRDQPQFQRYIQHKAERLRGEGKKVDVWR